MVVVVEPKKFKRFLRNVSQNIFVSVCDFVGGILLRTWKLYKVN